MALKRPNYNLKKGNIGRIICVASETYTHVYNSLVACTFCLRCKGKEKAYNSVIWAYICMGKSILSNTQTPPPPSTHTIEEPSLCPLPCSHRRPSVAMVTTADGGRARKDVVTPSHTPPLVGASFALSKATFTDTSFIFFKTKLQ